MGETASILAQVDETLEVSIAKLLDLISIASVSSQDTGRPGIKAAAEWLSRELGDMGFSVEIIETAGHPVVLASGEGDKTAPRLLFYGHYDVQPAEPFAAWNHPPFEPKIVSEDGLRRIYGRGASDSKSQLWSFISAMRAWKAVRGVFPANIVIVLEGEEETGSPSLEAFIASHRDALACDAAFICDSDMWSREQPAITTRLKGLIHDKVTVTTPNGDLHSGHFGTVTANPIRIVSRILASIHNEDGTIAIPGFYDGVDAVSDTVRAQWRTLENNGEVMVGVSAQGSVQEQGYSPLDLMWARPAIDFNGITGGNQGPGERSVTPASATARLSFRLVGRQDPHDIRERFRAFVRQQIPPGCSVSFEGIDGTAAVTVDDGSPFVGATARALSAEWNSPTVIKGTGGTVPIVRQLQDALGIDCVVVGFILPDDAIHAPNERYDVERFHKGTRSWVRVFDEIGTLNHDIDRPARTN